MLCSNFIIPCQSVLKVLCCQADRQTDGQTDTKTRRQTDTKTEGNADRHIDSYAQVFSLALYYVTGNL